MVKIVLEKFVGPIYAFLFARPAFYPLNKALFHLSLRGMGLFNCTKATAGEDYFVKKRLPQLLNTKKPILLDIGANIGTYTKLLSEVFPKSEIHSFEPHPKNFDKLSSYTHPAVTIHQSALGAENNDIVLYDRADQDGSSHASVYKKIITDWHQTENTSLNVPMQTLDQFAEENNIHQIDFLKIDTEGHEYDVLKGAQTLLSEHRILVIQFEFGCLDCYSNHFLQHFRDILPNHTLFRQLPRHLLPLNLPPVESELFGHQNIVAIPTPHMHSKK